MMKLKIFLTLTLFSIALDLLPYKLSMPYRARFFPGEPHVVWDNLIQLDLQFGGSDPANYAPHTPEIFEHKSIHYVSFDISYQPYSHIFFEMTGVFDHLKERRSLLMESPIDCSWDIGAITGGLALHTCPGGSVDFIDASFETGFVFPFNRHRALDIGIPCALYASVGIFDWVTFGGEFDIVPLFSDGQANFQFNGCWYLKADHFMRGFSALLGESFTHQEAEPDYPFDWEMCTLHLAASYDASQENHPYFPRITFFYDRILSGKNIARNSMIGCAIDVDF